MFNTAILAERIFAERKHHANSMNYNYIEIYKYITVLKIQLNVIYTIWEYRVILLRKLETWSNFQVYKTCTNVIENMTPRCDKRLTLVTDVSA